MDALSRTAKRILSDIKKGDNIEAYAIATAAFIVAVLGLFEDIVSTEIKLSVILAALGLLVFRLTVPEEKIRLFEQIIGDRSEFSSFPELIKDAEKLWIYAPSAINVLNGSTKALQKLLGHQKGEFRIVVQDPDNLEMIEAWRLYIDNTVKTRIHELPDSLRNVCNLFRQMEDWEMAGVFAYGFLSYYPGFSLVLIDPHKSTGRIIVELHGVQNQQINDRMHITITKRMSLEWFEYWTKQFEHIWDSARKPKA